MKAINYVSVPATRSEDINPGKTTWKDGKCVSIDEGRDVTLYIGHRESKQTEEKGREAYPVRVSKPVTRDKAVNAAEMDAYDLVSAMDVASFGASMSRKFRENPADPEVREHDEFISWVKDELTKIGY